MFRQFEDVVLPHLDAAFNYARWLTKNDADAQDVVQDACVRAVRFFSSSATTMPAGGCFGTVMSRLARGRERRLVIPGSSAMMEGHRDVS